MKRILFLFTALVLSSIGFSQTVIFQETFGSGTNLSAVTNFTNLSNDWTLDDGTNSPTPPLCNVIGSSGASMLFGQDASPASNFEEVGTIVINTSIYSNLQLSWNYLRANVAGGPAVTCQINNTGAAGNWTTVAYTPGSNTDNVWGAVAPITLPSNAISTTLYIRWTYNSTGSSGSNYIAIDDVKLTGNSSPIFYWDGATAVTSTAAWWSNPNATGTHPNDFVTNSQTFFLINNTSASLTSPWAISGSNTILHIGDGTAGNKCQLIIPTGFALTLSGGAGVNVTNSSTLTMLNTTFPSISNVTINPTSTIEFGQSSPVSIWTSNSYGNLFLSGGSTKTQSGSILVSGEFNIASGTTYVMIASATRNTRLQGIITCNGNITPNLSHITIDGSGTVGTLNFNGTNPINNFTFNRSGQTLTLGNDLNVNGTTNISNGTINLNGKTLKLNGASTTLHSSASAGVFTGSSASAITFSGSGSVTNSLFMDQTSSSTKTLKALVTTKSLSVGNLLEITDSVKCSGGTLSTGGFITLKSTASLKGRIANCTGGSVSGNITVETFAAGGTTDWSVLGGSGVSGLTFNSWYNQIPMAIEGSATGVTSIGGQYFESVQGWNENDAYGYDTTITVTSPITTGKGYWVYLGTGLTTTGDMLWTVSGSAISGPVNVPISTGGPQSGMNLVANPYPSPISWAKVLANSPGMNDAVYIYNADVGQTQYVNGVSSHPSTSGANDVIPMGQGFYVQSGGASSLNFTESCKVSNNTGSNPLLRSNNTESASNIGTVIRLKIQGSDALDYAAIRFHANATTAFDGHYDAYKIYDSPGYVGYPGVWSKRTVISTQLNNVDYGVNSIPYAHFQNAVLPVVARVYSSGQYTISGEDLQNLPANACVTLWDKLTNVHHDLKSGAYICTISDTTYAARFELTVCADITTDIKSQTSTASNHIDLNKDAKGVFVNFDFEKSTNANIIVTNVLGQKIMDTKKVKTSKDKIYLDLNTSEQLIFVTVETENEKVTKKFLNFN